jgi:hypothetical protein
MQRDALAAKVRGRSPSNPHVGGALSPLPAASARGHDDASLRCGVADPTPGAAPVLMSRPHGERPRGRSAGVVRSSTVRAKELAAADRHMDNLVPRVKDDFVVPSPARFGATSYDMAGMTSHPPHRRSPAQRDAPKAGVSGFLTAYSPIHGMDSAGRARPAVEVRFPRSPGITGDDAAAAAASMHGAKARGGAGGVGAGGGGSAVSPGPANSGWLRSPGPVAPLSPHRRPRVTPASMHSSSGASASTGSFGHGGYHGAVTADSAVLRTGGLVPAGTASAYHRTGVLTGSAPLSRMAGGGVAALHGGGGDGGVVSPASASADSVASNAAQAPSPSSSMPAPVGGGDSARVTLPLPMKVGYTSAVAAAQAVAARTLCPSLHPRVSATRRCW